MARYNTVITQSSASSTTTLTSPTQGLFTELTGTSYTVNIADATQYSGFSQTFYNAASGAITLTAAGGVFRGFGSSGTSSQVMPTGSTVTIYSDGTNWVIVSSIGLNFTANTLSAVSTVTLSPAGANVTISPTSAGTVTISPNGALTMSPGSAGSIDNMSIGATTRSTGAFTTLAANSTFSLTLASGTHTISSTTASTGTGSGALTIGGGLGVAGRINATDFTGTVGANGASTGAFTTLTANSTFSLTVSSGTHTISSTTNSSGTGSGALVISGGLGVANTIYCATLNETSSIKLKENIKPITNALSSVLKLKGVTYDRKDGSTKNESGLIAEHVYKVLPSVVGLDAKGKPNAIQYSKLTAYLIESVKDLQAEIDELKSKLKKETVKTKAASTKKATVKKG